MLPNPSTLTSSSTPSPRAAPPPPFTSPKPSCPGTLHFTNLAHTARNTVPNNPTAKCSPPSPPTLSLPVTGRHSRPQRPQRQDKISLNDRTLWNTMVRRAYLFSKADKLINWRSVLEHARDTESRGMPVFVKLFEKSSHCAHIRAKEGAERYWSTVQKAWDTRVNGVSELVEDEAGQGKKDGFEVKVEEIDVKLQALGLGGQKRCTCSDCRR